MCYIIWNRHEPCNQERLELSFAFQLFLGKVFFEQDGIIILCFFPFTIVFFSSKTHRGRLTSAAQSDDESEYAASRFVPALKTALTEMAQDALSFDDYPSVLPMPENTGRAGGGKSARSGRRGEATSARKTTGASSKWAKSGRDSGGNNAGGPVRYVGGRHIIFMIGGLSYNELRAAEEVSRKESREIIIGSSTFLTPAEFMKDLNKLGQDED